MKKLGLYISGFILAAAAYSQQLHQSSMYMMNNYLLNPAEGGTEDFIDLQAGYRTQWVGFDDGKGPKTIYLSGHTPLGKHSVNKDTSHSYNNSELEEFVKPMGYHGVGGMVISDDAGHFQTLEVKASYSYHMPMGRKFFLSFGGFVGIKQLSVEGNLQSDSQGGTDPISGAGEGGSSLNPDLTLGLWGYHKKYYFGVSMFQVLGNPISVTDSDGNEGNLSQHIYITGGYKVDISEKLFLVPSTLIKILPGAPVTADLNAKLNYNHKFWGGASYRFGSVSESLVLLAGITLKDIVDVGYSYDITLNGLNQVSNGSHEIMLGLRLPNHQHHAPPKQFW